MFTDKIYSENKSFADITLDNVIWSNGVNLDPLAPKNEVKPSVTVIDLGKMLLQCSKDGDVTKVHKLIARGAPFASDWLGMTALHFAAISNNYEICEILLRGGINKDAKTKVDRTPLHFAVFEGHESIVELLLSKKCDVNAKDMLKMTALHWAVEKRHKSIVRLLLKYNADPEVISKFDKTPMLLAVQTCQADILHELETARQVHESAETLLQDFQQNQSETNEAVNSIALDSQHSPNFDIPPILTESNDVTDNENSMPINNVPSINSSASTNFIDSNSNSNLDDENINFVEPIVQLQNLDEPKQIDASALEILKNHGIAMLPIDEPENDLLTSALQSGRKLVLSEAGKLVLNETKSKKLPSNNNSDFNSQKSNTFSHAITTKTVKKPPILVKAKGMSLKSNNKNVKIITMDMFKQMYGGEVANSIKKLQAITTKSSNSNIITHLTIPKITKLISTNSSTIKRPILSKACIKQQPPQLTQIQNITNERQSSSNRMECEEDDELPPNIIEVCSDSDMDEGNKEPINESKTNSSRIQQSSNQILSQSSTIDSRTTPSSSQLATTSVQAMDITEISRQLLELRKQTEDLQKQLELSQKQSEEYKIRLERLEKEKELASRHTNNYS